MIAPHLAAASPAAPLPGPALTPVIGHRGAAAHAPENTLVGLRRAKALGCAWVEFDVRLTADGVPVLCHDARLDRTTDGSGLVSALPYAALRSCDAGSWFAPGFAGEPIPTLEAALLLAAELGLGANIELKAERGRQHAVGAAVAAALQQLEGRLPAVLVSSFHPAALDAVQSLAPLMPLGVLFRAVPRDWRDLASRLGCRVIGADHRRLRPGRAAEIHGAGYRLAAFTVNDPARALALFDWGVGAVFSDVPDAILAALRAAGSRQAASACVNLH